MILDNQNSSLLIVKSSCRSTLIGNRAMTSPLSCMNRTSWRTTLYGAMAALATWAMDMQDPAWLATAGKVIMALSVFLLGKNARDRYVSSEDEGAN
jgi:hypothetical protein